jgi:hypothetical protein
MKRDAWIAALLLFLAATAPARALASATIVNDPQGFNGIPWGAPLAGRPDLVLAQSMDRVQGYDLKQGPPPLGQAKVESLRLFVIDGKFGRVTIRYRGRQTHAQVLAYLESAFGPVERAPGSMVRGLNQQFNWRGPETEVNLTFEAKGERGYLFIESRTLSPRFNDFLSDTGSGY